MHSIFDGTFNTAGRVEMYRAWAVPEIDPDQPPARIENWSDEEREAYCGIYKEVA